MKSFILLVAFFCLFHVTIASVSFYQEPRQHMHPPPSSERSNHRQKREDPRSHRNEFESTTYFWKSEAQKKLRQQLDKKDNNNVAKNVILFLGDGMSVSTITAARIYSGQKCGRTGEESVLSFEEFPHIGLSKVFK